MSGARASANPLTAPTLTPIATIMSPSDSTRPSSCFGAEPIARLTPNPRVRALTENARTLAIRRWR